MLPAALLAGAALAGPAQAVDFVVTNLNDGDAGSLRQAIEDANGNGMEDTITFDASLAGGTILLSIGQLTIADDTAAPDLTVDGDLDDDGMPDITVDANGGSRVFFIAFGANVTLQGLVITGGSNEEGGGIFNDGTLTVANSTISGNSAGFGGGIRNFGTLTVESSTIRDNGADFGGGIENPGTLTVTNSTIRSNNASIDGGGIANLAGTLTVTNSTISGNNASIDGGGIRNSGTLTVANSTISDNSANAAGGGIFNLGMVEIKSSIIAGNTGEDCDDPLTSLGFNLDGDGTCELDQASDLPNTDPMLGALMNNAGPTETHALLENSPAIDHIPLADCTDAQGNPVETDQQGVERPQPRVPNGHCDIGAFELVQDVSLTIVDLIDAFDDAVDDGTLMGAGRGGSAAGRLNALRNMLLAAGDLLDQGEVDDACTQLQDAADRTDGEFPPPDFVQDELGCFA